MIRRWHGHHFFCGRRLARQLEPHRREPVERRIGGRLEAGNVSPQICAGIGPHPAAYDLAVFSYSILPEAPRHGSRQPDYEIQCCWYPIIPRERRVLHAGPGKRLPMLKPKTNMRQVRGEVCCTRSNDGVEHVGEIKHGLITSPVDRRHRQPRRSDFPKAEVEMLRQKYRFHGFGEPVVLREGGGRLDDWHANESQALAG